MTQPSRHVQWIVWGGLALTIGVIAAAFALSRLQSPGEPLPVYGQVPAFALTNQSGSLTARTDLDGRVWVANLIFTRCPGPCAKMTRAMAEVQSGLSEASPVHLVSLTADPEFDSPEVLSVYARRFNADPRRWQFLTGSRKQIFDLAVDGLMLVLQEKTPGDRVVEEDLFLHSTLFVVVDRLGRIRGVVEGAEPGASARVLEMVNRLLKEK